MKVNRAALLRALRNVKPALGKTVQTATGNQDFGRHFIFSDGQVCAYNGELYISTPLPEGLDFEGALPAKELADLVGKKKTVDIEVSAERKKLFLGADEMKARLVRDSKIKSSVWDLVQPAKDSWVKVPADFQEKLKLCLFTASKSKNNPILTCVHWQNQILETCDNSRITRCTLSSAVPEGVDVLIPIETASALKLRIYDLSLFAINDDWLHFQCANGSALSCRLYESKFPPIDNIFNMNFGKQFRFPAKSASALNESIDCAEKDALSVPFVQVEIHDGIMKVNASKIRPYSEFERIEPISSNESIQFWINPHSLIEILQRGCDRVALSERCEDFSERFLRFEGKDFTHIIGVAPVLDNLIASATSGVAEPDIRPGFDLGRIEMYCAGSLGFEFNHEKLKSEMENRLLSFAYRGQDLNRYTNDYRSDYKNLMVDSGAFTFWTSGYEINLDEYIRYCLSKVNDVEYFVSLDVIPGSPGQKNLRLLTGEIERSASQGYENYNKMLEAGIAKEKLIHVFHQGENFRWLKKMVENMDYIGLSPGNDRSTEEKIEWLIKCMEYVTDSNGRPIVRFHGFAVTSLRLVRLFPWTSIDSATWGILAGMGRAMIPYKRGGEWDFSSDTPLQFACSHVKSHPEHIDNQRGIVQTRIVDAYLKDLGLKRGKSEFVVREKSYKLKEKERGVTKKLGERIAQEQGPTVIERLIEELMGGMPAFKEPAPNEKWVEIVKEPGVINSYNLRAFLNLYYLKQFLKTLPEDRKFVRPKNRVDLHYFLIGSHEVEVAPVSIADDSEKGSPASPNRIELPFPKPPEEKRKSRAAKLSGADKARGKRKAVQKIPWKRASKKGGVRHQDSVEKIIERYFSAITRVPFEVMGVTIEPTPLYVSHLLGRGYTCFEHKNCGACCQKFTLDYIPGEGMPEGLTKRPFEFNSQTIDVFSDLQNENSGYYCKHLRLSDGLCGIHGSHPFSCIFELIRPIDETGSIGRHRMAVAQYGRSFNMTRIDGTKGAPCTIKEPTKESIEDSIEKLERLEKWATYFGLTETHIPKIIRLMKDNGLKKWKEILFPKDWTQEQREEFLKRRT
ncbi:MAG: hypothetical protein ACLP29_08095 [Dissulfurispiraceae bacterium]